MTHLWTQIFSVPEDVLQIKMGIISFTQLSLGHIHGGTTKMLGGRPTSISPYLVTAFATRLITQSYFPGDPLLDLDPIFQSTPKEHGSYLLRLLTLNPPKKALPSDTSLILFCVDPRLRQWRLNMPFKQTPSQTIGPFFALRPYPETIWL